MSASQTDGPLLSGPEARALLGVSPPTFRKIRLEAGLSKFQPAGTLPKYYRSELDSLLAAWKGKPSAADHVPIRVRPGSPADASHNAR